MQWLKRVPGFRSGTRWKQIVAVVGYMIIIGLMVLDSFGFVLGLLMLGWVGDRNQLRGPTRPDSPPFRR